VNSKSSLHNVCCARAARGQAIAEPKIPLTKSRRLIASPTARDYGDRHLPMQLQQEFASREMGSQVMLRSSNESDRMSEVGLGRVKTSALAARVEYLERIAYD
jgi:hypothetical protein